MYQIYCPECSFVMNIKRISGEIITDVECKTCGFISTQYLSIDIWVVSIKLSSEFRIYLKLYRGVFTGLLQIADREEDIYSNYRTISSVDEGRKIFQFIAFS